MTAIDEIKALIALGEKAQAVGLSPVFSLKTGWKIGQIRSHTASPLSGDDDHDAVEYACAAANARDTIALAARIVDAAKRSLDKADGDWVVAVNDLAALLAEWNKETE